MSLPKITLPLLVSFVLAGCDVFAQAAQSPFKNLHPFGIVGASVAPGTNAYRIEQRLRLHPARARGQVHVNFEQAGQKWLMYSLARLEQIR